MTDRTQPGPNAGPNGDKLNWRDTNGVETTDSQADGTDVGPNTAEPKSKAAPDATPRTGKGDGTAPDQRTRDDKERSDENRGINTP